MKAIRVHKFGGPEVLQCDKNVSIPKVDATRVLVSVKAIGVNPVETYIRAGRYSRLPALPYCPGENCAGLVQEVGSEVTKFKQGDRVFVGNTAHGSYCEYAMAEEDDVQLLHNELTYKQGAAIWTPYQTAYRALFIRGGARPGNRVLVHGGSGGVGIAAIQFARANGMHVISTAGSEKGMEVVSCAGAHEIYSHRDKTYMDKIRGGSGVDVIVENASHVNLGDDLTMLAKNGRVIIVGSRGPIEINPRDTMARESTITGISLFSSTKDEMKEGCAAIQGGMEAGWLRPIVGKEFAMEDACKAHEDIIASSAIGKMILTVSS